MKKNIVDMSEVDLESLINRISSGSATEDDVKLVRALGETLFHLEDEMMKHGASIKRLLKLFFGKESEKLVKQYGTKDPTLSGDKKKKKAKGHGRRKSSDLIPDKETNVCLEEHKEGDVCPKCNEGSLSSKEPEVVVRFTGSAPIKCEKYNLQRLRCTFCGETFKAPLPKEAGTSRYSPSAVSTIACFKYGSAFHIIVWPLFKKVLA